MIQYQTGPAPTARKNKFMKVEFAVSAIVILVVACFSPAEAQQTPKAIPRIGYISAADGPGSHSPLFEAFRLGLRHFGYVDGKDILIEIRYAEGRLDRIPGLVNELVQQKVDVIVAANNVGIRAAKKATKLIPIVMISSVDPVAAGYVQSFAHPAGNVTGLAWLNRAISAKRLELLGEMLPKISKVAVFWDADGPGPAIAIKAYEAAARAFNWEIISLQVRGPNPDFAESISSCNNGAFRRAYCSRKSPYGTAHKANFRDWLKTIDCRP